MLSRKFIETVRLSKERQYTIAYRAGIHPTILSKLINGIEIAKNGDPRIIKVGKVLGLRKEELFEKD